MNVHKNGAKRHITLAEAFEVLQNNPSLDLQRWTDDAAISDSVQQAVITMLNGLRINPPSDPEQTTEIIAHVLWLVAIAFEAGRIYEGGKPE